MATYTVTVTVTLERTFARKVNARVHRDELQRKLARVLADDDWTVGTAKVRTSSVTAAAEQRKQRERAKRREVTQRNRDRRIAPGLPSDARAWAAGVLERENMKSWRIVLKGGAAYARCWNPHAVRAPDKEIILDGSAVGNYSIGRRLLTPNVRKYLLRKGVGLTVVPAYKIALLHEIAHVRVWRKSGFAVGHDDTTWRLLFLNLLKRHAPEAFTEEARVLTALQ